MASARKPPVRARPEPKGKLAVVADVHAHNFTYKGGEWSGGLNDRGRECIAVLERALAQAEAEGATHFFVAGDLFHVQRPEPALIAAIQRAFAKAKKLGIVVVPGNHDMLAASARDGNTACAPLWQEATIVNEPTLFEVGTMDVLAVPFCATIPMREYLAEVLLARKDWTEGRGRVIVTHVGVYGDDPPPWAVGARDAISSARLLDLMNSFEIGAAFVGNYHDAGIWQDEHTAAAICQVGTLCPHGFGDAGFTDRGKVAMFDGLAGYSAVAVPGPRFVTIREGDPVPEVPAGCKAFARVERTAAHELAAATFAGYAVEEADLAAQVAEASSVEFVAEDPVEAIKQDVERRPLPAEVPRDEVLNATLDFWRRAS